MGASKACIFLLTIAVQLLFGATAQQVERRVPQGFLGMRGKRYYNYGSEFYKRKPQFFVGVKGKKNYNPFLDMEYKRVPMGFVGMRGKKEDYPDPGFKNNDNYELFPDMGYKRAPMGFVGMRGKKDFSYPDFVDDRDKNNLDLFTDMDYKRAPMGFVGMRGKKEFSNPSVLEMYSKRAPMGFVGMRGKKDFYNSDSITNNFDSFADMDYKRAPMGFLGMRGKKESDFMVLPDRSGSLIGQIDYTTDDNNNGDEYPILHEVINEYLKKLRANPNTEVSTESSDISDERVNEIEKRANIHRFYGVRGKKSVQVKRPYDVSFRGKFIGVRGKKDLKNQEAQEINFLPPRPWPKKWAGFQGMRGKKWTDDDTVLDSEQSSEVVAPNEV